MHNRSTFHAILIKHNYYVKSDDICIVHEHHTRASFNRLLLFIAEIIFLLCFRGSFLQREFFYTGTFSKKTLQIKKKCAIISKSYAGMAELADAHGSGPCESDFMQVQVLLSAPIFKVLTSFSQALFLCLILLTPLSVCNHHCVPA